MQLLESAFLPLARLQVAFEMTVIEGETNGVETSPRKKGDIRLGDISLIVSIEECAMRFLTQHFQKLLANLPLRPGKTYDVILDQHPTAQIHSAKANRTSPFDYLASLRLKDGWMDDRTLHGA
jgi:predicted Zn-dependent protease